MTLAIWIIWTCGASVAYDKGYGIWKSIWWPEIIIAKHIPEARK